MVLPGLSLFLGVLDGYLLSTRGDTFPLVRFHEQTAGEMHDRG
jgi:hypothetical protein